MTKINLGLLHHLIQHKRTSETVKPNTLHTEKLHDVEEKIAQSERSTENWKFNLISMPLHVLAIKSEKILPGP